MKKKYDAQNFYDNVIESIEAGELENDFPSAFYESYYRGKRTISQKQEIESKKFDIKWIETIESYLSSIEMIARSVKSNLKYESEVVPVELARNISSESVTYLTSHTEDIKEINEDGVIPQRILTTVSEVDYGIYENRFIMTLIIRLKDFVTERLKILKQNLNAAKRTSFNFENNFIYEENDFKISVNINQEESIDQRKISEYNKSVYERAERLSKLINRLYRSSFMELMKGYNKVTPPIMKTQVILKNPHFRNAYLLWLYLDKSVILEFETENEIKNKRITSLYDKRINQSMLLLFSTILLNDGDENDGSELNDRPNYKKTKPNVNDKGLIIESIDDGIEVEDIGLNEWFLNKAKQIFKKQLDEKMNSEDSYKVSLKKAITESLSITNGLYASFFEIDTDDDIFRRLIKSEDPMVALKDARDKHEVARVIREVKEKDYLEAIELEKKWYEELGIRQNNLIKSEEYNQDEELKKFIETEKARFNEQFKALSNAHAAEKTNIVRKNKKDLSELDKQLKLQLKEEQARLKELQKKNLSESKARIKELEAKRKEKELSLQKLRKAQLAEKIKQDKETLRKKHKEMINELRKKAEEVKQSDIIKKLEIEVNRLEDAEAKIIAYLKSQSQELDRTIFSSKNEKIIKTKKQIDSIRENQKTFSDLENALKEIKDSIEEVKLVGNDLTKDKDIV